MEMSNGVWFYLFIVCKDKLFINALACRMITCVTFETNEDSQNSRDIEMLSFSRQSFPQFKVSVWPTDSLGTHCPLMIEIVTNTLPLKRPLNSVSRHVRPALMVFLS